MPTDPIQRALEQLQSAVREHAPKSAVKATATLTSQGLEWHIEHRDPQSLVREGVSMRNLAGEWIMPPPAPFQFP